MDQTTSSLCKGIRACGLPKNQTLELVNTIKKWEKNSGVEWTIERLKAYKHWYQTHLSGEPDPPKFMRKSKDNLPLGIFGSIFKIKDPAKVFAILSASTVYVADKPTDRQLDKTRKALEAEPLSREQADDFLSHVPLPKRTSVPKLRPPKPASIDCITGVSIPVSIPGQKPRSKRIDGSKQSLLDGLADSFRSLPEPTYRMLYDLELEDQLPDNFVKRHWLGEESSKLSNLTGALSCLQQPEYKARFIANPNRVTQHYTRPLADALYATLEDLKTDCTFNQESGISWVQDQLSRGILLSGADLSSATDLLDAETSVRAVCQHFYGFDPITNKDHRSELFQIRSDSIVDKITFSRHVQHFLELSRCEWSSQAFGEPVKWKRGQPLGLAPSFALLGLTNNLVGTMAAQCSGIEPHESFRVIGDDIIMKTEMLDDYTRLINLLGGEINHSKTMTSSTVAEFAGRIIQPHRSFHKTVKYKAMGDDSFMSTMSTLGPQASYLLRPRQKEMYDRFKAVPGFVVPGPYPSAYSGDFPFSTRYEWYLIGSGLATEHLEPDREEISFHAVQRDLMISQLSRGLSRALIHDVVPAKSHGDFQSPLTPRASGDPRRKSGVSQLEYLEKVSKLPGSVTIEEYSSMNNLPKKLSPKPSKKQLTPKIGEVEKLSTLPVEDSLDEGSLQVVTDSFETSVSSKTLPEDTGFLDGQALVPRKRPARTGVFVRESSETSSLDREME